MNLIKANVFPLTPTFVELLKDMHFPVLEGAKFLAFYEDGQVQFFEEIAVISPLNTLPHFCMINYYQNMNLTNIIE